jgi:hypothetical protein
VIHVHIQWHPIKRLCMVTTVLRDQSVLSWSQRSESQLHAVFQIQKLNSVCCNKFTSSKAYWSTTICVSVPSNLYIALLADNRLITILRNSFFQSKLNHTRNWENIMYTYHLGHKVKNGNFHGQNFSPPSKAFIKRITERNLLLLVFLDMTHESIL